MSIAKRRADYIAKKIDRAVAKKREKLIIFDCNGVLRNFSWEGVFLGYKTICKHFRIDFSSVFGEEDNLENFKYCHTHNLRHDFFGVGLDGKDFARVCEIFHQVYDPYTRVFPWVEKFFQELSLRSVIVILSNSTTLSLEETFNGTSRHVSLMAGNDRAPKNSDEVRRIMAQYGIAPDRTYFVGDTICDIGIAEVAGVEKTVGVAWGATQTKGDLLDMGADEIFYRPEELMQFLQN